MNMPDIELNCIDILNTSQQQNLMPLKRFLA
jgi:hypothetical protein